MAVPVCSLIQMCMCAFHRINHPVWFLVISETFQFLIQLLVYAIYSWFHRLCGYVCMCTPFQIVSRFDFSIFISLTTYLDMM